MASIISLLILVVVLHVDGCDPQPLQDFCIAVNDSNATVFVNGKTCKDPNTATSDDFHFSGLNQPGNITNLFGSVVTRMFVHEMPALNTLGLSMARIDYDSYGADPPHSHPRASEILMVMEGTIYAGFISSNRAGPNEDNNLYSKVLGPGDIYVFPKGLIHFQYNLGDSKGLSFSSFSSEEPGIVTASKAIFGSKPSVYPDLLAKSFQMETKEVNRLLSLQWTAANA